MKLKKLTFSCIIVFLMIPLLTQAQKREIIKIRRLNGDTVETKFTLRYCKGNHIFPSDSKDFIRIMFNGIKVKLPKSDIAEIILLDGSKYEILANGKYNFVIGYYISKGKLNIFKEYTYDRNEMPMSTGGESAINKTAKISYYLVENNKLIIFNTKDDFKGLAASCEKFSAHLEKQKRLKSHHEIQSLFKFYNDNCR